MREAKYKQIAFMAIKEMRNFKTSSDEYRKWLGHYLKIISEDWEARDKSFQECTPFEFLRSTFYRWVEWWPEVVPKELQEAPQVLGVGDLHIENFGTWRDAEGRLVWGVNDFDECCCLPYTNDLVRLATSVWLAIEDHLVQQHPSIRDLPPKDRQKTIRKKLQDLRKDSSIQNEASDLAKEACSQLLTGYQNALADGCQPIVLAEDNDWLREIALRNLLEKEVQLNTTLDAKDSFDKFWKEMGELGPIKGDIPRSAWEVLTASLPESGLDFKLGRREAGRGSLGRQRFTAVVNNWRGGILVREVKALAPSAWNWDKDVDPKPADQILYAEMLHQAVRAPDPYVWIHLGQQSWVIRRLAPDSGKVKLKDLPSKERWMDLWEAMGFETANVHVRQGDILIHLQATFDKNPAWLFEAAHDMRKVTLDDWKEVYKQE